MDRRIKIRHLQALTEIVRQGSLKAAAERLFLTQPAISRTLAELEGILGASLLTRGRGGVALTSQGEFFYNCALQSLAALERGLAGMEEAGGRAVSRIRVGALPTVAARLIPGVVADLSGVAPDMRLMIVDGPHAHLTRLLHRGELDVLIGRLGEPDAMRSLSFSQLYLEDIVAVVRPGHPILSDPDLQRIVDWPIIFPPARSAIRPFVERLLIAEGIRPPPHRIESVSGAFGRAYTSESDAIWFISEGVVAREIAEGQLARLPIGPGMTEGPVGLMTRAEAAEDIAVQIFHQSVRRVVVRLGLD